MKVRLKRKDIVAYLSKRDGYRCYMCDMEFNEKQRATIDHVKPLSKGGTWDLENLKLACRRCNVVKGNREFVNGRLEMPEPRDNWRSRRDNRRRLLDNFCKECANGRLLLHGEECASCGSTNSATLVPTYLWREPKECDHDQTACWLCFIGLIARKSALESLLIG